MEKRKDTQKDITSFFVNKSKISSEDDNNNVPNNTEVDISTHQARTELSTSEPCTSTVQINNEQPYSPEYNDLGLFDRSKLSDDEKSELINKNFRPGEKFIFPLRQFKNQKRKFGLLWLRDY